MFKTRTRKKREIVKPKQGVKTNHSRLGLENLCIIFLTGVRLDLS